MWQHTCLLFLSELTEILPNLKIHEDKQELNCKTYEDNPKKPLYFSLDLLKYIKYIPKNVFFSLLALESPFYDLMIKCHTWPLDGATEGLLVFEVSKTNLLYRRNVLCLFLLFYFMYYLICEAVPFASFMT